MNVMKIVELLIYSKTAFEMEDTYLFSTKLFFQIGSDEYEVNLKGSSMVVQSMSILYNSTYIFDVIVSLLSRVEEAELKKKGGNTLWIGIIFMWHEKHHKVG